MRLLLTALLCLVAECLSAQYSLTVESYPAVQSGLTTYRFYVNMTDPTDRMSAVYGNNQSHMLIETPEGAYNSPYNPSWNASGINPAFLGVFPELSDDTYATIGLTGPAASSGISGASDPSLVEDNNQPISPYFQVDGATSVESNTVIGAAWYILNVDANGLPDSDIRVLIMQVTTSGQPSGQINYQVFPNGNEMEAERWSTEFNGNGTYQGTLFVQIVGCMDSTACNYDPNANLQPIGACTYPGDIDPLACDCEGNELNACGGCGDDFSSCEGCTIEFACNYDPLAGVDDGSCEFFCPGCTDPTACNYDASAQQDDGNCLFWDECGECGGSGVLGCMDESSCTYNELATCEDIVSCLYVDECGDCGGNGIAGCTEPSACDYDPWATCNPYDECIYPGCDDPSACNYFPGGCNDPSVCIYPNACGNCEGNGDIPGCTDPNSCTYNAAATCDDGSCLYLDACDVCGGGGIAPGACDCDGNTLDQCGVCGGDGTSCVGCTYELACNYDPTATILDVASCEFGTCPGCTVQGACNYNPTLSQDDGSCEWCSCAQSVAIPTTPYYLTVEGFPAVQEGLTTYRFYVNMSDPTDRMSAVYGNNEANMFIQTPEGAFNSTANPMWNASGINPAFLTVFPELSDDTYATIGLTSSASVSGIPGTLDPSIVEDAVQPITPYFLDNGATNLVSTTLTGSSWYVLNTATNSLPDENMRVIILQVTTAGSISGTLNYQVFPLGSGIDAEYYHVTFDGAGNFDSAGAIPLGTIGCTDESAANYCPDAVEDDGSCFDEYIGCTDPLACNYSSTATVNDVSLCIYPSPLACDCQGGYPGCLDPLGCNFDPNASCEDLCIYPGLCGICGCDNCYPACTDTAACNYDPNATCDDGTCEYPEEGYNCEGQCLEALTSPGCLCYDYYCPSCDLLDLLPPGCSDPAACNYDPLWNCLVQLCEYPEAGACDCDGSVLDALGVCGGDCPLDFNQNGICDTEELGGGATECGWGTYWNEDSMACVLLVPPYLGDYGDFSALNPCYFNLDNSSSVGAEDLLSFLGVYGQTADCAGYADASWSCGDPVSYQGYDYATVQIGDQCWFAENLRNESYRNGDAIPATLSDSEWWNTTSGAVKVYGEGGSECNDASPDGDACDEAWSLNEYGRLYNWYAVDDARGLCPSGWHVPTDGEWMTMEMALGMSEAEANSWEWRGTDQGVQMKTNYGWSDGPNGTNTSGYAGLPGGYRYSTGSYQAGSGGYCWSSSPTGPSNSDAWYRIVEGYREEVGRNAAIQSYGFSVRCIKDAE